MTTGRSKCIRLFLMLGISLLASLFLAYSVYVDTQETELFSSEARFEDPDDENSSICRNDSSAFMPIVSTNPSLFSTYSGWESSFLSPYVTSHTRLTIVLRC